MAPLIRGVQHVARSRFQSNEIDSSIELRRPSRSTIDNAILHQHTAVNRPGRLQLPERPHRALAGCDLITPRQLTTVGIEAIQPSVTGAEQHQTAMICGRRIDTSTGGKLPNCRPLAASRQTT